MSTPYIVRIHIAVCIPSYRCDVHTRKRVLEGQHVTLFNSIVSAHQLSFHSPGSNEGATKGKQAGVQQFVHRENTACMADGTDCRVAGLLHDAFHRLNVLQLTVHTVCSCNLQRSSVSSTISTHKALSHAAATTIVPSLNRCLMHFRNATMQPKISCLVWTAVPRC